MSIFDKNFYAEDSFLKEENLKEKIVSYLNSGENIFQITENDGEYSWIDEYFTISNIFELFLNINKFPFDYNQLDELSLYEVIEIFWNIKNKIYILIEKYKLDYEKKNSCHIYGNTLKINEKITFKIEYFLKNKNITWIKKKSNWILNYTKNEIFENSTIKMKDSFNDFLKIKSNLDEKSITRKEEILGSLKNQLDCYFNKKNKIESNSFILFNNAELKQYWLSIIVHMGREETNNENWEKIKYTYNNSTIKEKHILLNNMFDAIVFLQYKINENSLNNK